MDVIQTEDVCSVILFDVRLSESEMQIFADALHYALTTLDDKDLNWVFNVVEGKTSADLAEGREFIEDRYKELMTTIKTYCRDEFLKKRFKDWIIEDPS